KRIHPASKLPVYGHPGDAGLDLFSVADHDIAPGEVFAVPTGLQVAVPAGHVGLVWDKSGLSLKGVHRLAGVVDAGYRGEVQVVMINLGDAPFAVKKGLKIAQMLVQPVAAVAVVEA
ncbi:MAG: dUTP diphosphatase, partial [Candidatus Aminicenantes bacterium]|nr:dUTP diphosphatase [Candidatus Aminicenantes bacterium]